MVLDFSAWTGTHGVHPEDLYVLPAARGAGHGRALPAELARVCAERGYERFQWWVLNWNEPAIGFYEPLGAEPVDEWTAHGLSGEPLRAPAAGRTPPPGRREQPAAPRRCEPGVTGEELGTADP
ncbi:hypothetical protein SUDANB106_03858 [Streptomyces sp. enrichment culture]